MSLERIFLDHRPALRRCAERMTGDPDAAEDICQEAFARALRHGPAGAAPETLRAWLSRTARNLAVDELRRRGRRLPATAPAPFDPEGGAPARAALADLTTHERFVLLLRYDAGLSLREVGALLGVSEEAARKRVARARARFRRALAVHDADPRPLVLVMVREDDPEPYRQWLADAGARVRIRHDPVSERDALLTGALVVGGAQSDLHPRLYGERAAAELHGRLDARRDLRDLAALRAALREDLPVLGICSGHQLLNLAGGGSLHQDLSGHAGDGHDVRTRAATRARSLFGARVEVASRHHQGVRRVGAGLEVAASSPDGLVEAVERRDRRFAVGVQWRPQLDAGSPGSRRLAEALVSAARR